MTSKEHLVQTLSLIREKGWTPKINYDISTGRVGLFGAMSIPFTRLAWELPKSATGISTYNQTKDIFRQANGIADILAWEDKRGRTQADIEAALEKAIAACPKGL